MLPSDSAHPGHSPAKGLDMLVRKPEVAYSDEETARRAEAVIRRMLNTRPQPRRTKRQPEDAKSKAAPKVRSKPPS